MLSFVKGDLIIIAPGVKLAETTTTHATGGIVTADLPMALGYRDFPNNNDTNNTNNHVQQKAALQPQRPIEEIPQMILARAFFQRAFLPRAFFGGAFFSSAPSRGFFAIASSLPKIFLLLLQWSGHSLTFGFRPKEIFG